MTATNEPSAERARGERAVYATGLLLGAASRGEALSPDELRDVADVIAALRATEQPAPEGGEAALVAALRNAFPHFQSDEPVTPDAIKAIGNEYANMVMTWVPFTGKLEFVDQDGKTRKLTYSYGDSEAGINDGWTNEDEDWVASDASPAAASQPKTRTCASCSGSGFIMVQGAPWSCRHCGGTGSRPASQPALPEGQLRECPFCGGEAERVDFDVNGEDDTDPNAGGSCISCKRCGASSPVHFEFKENLYSSWNERRTEQRGAAGSGEDELLERMDDAAGSMSEHCRQRLYPTWGELSDTAELLRMARSRLATAERYSEDVWSAFVAACESIEEESYQEFQKDGLSEHELGFRKGMKFAAKSIRRSVEHPKYASPSPGSAGVENVLVANIDTARALIARFAEENRDLRSQIDAAEQERDRLKECGRTAIEAGEKMIATLTEERDRAVAERDYYKSANEALAGQSWEVIDSIGIRGAVEAETERCAKIVEDRCAEVLSKQTGEDYLSFNYGVDTNLRMAAVLLPDLAAAIRARPETEDQPSRGGG